MKLILFPFFISISLFANTINIPQVETTTSNAKKVAVYRWKLVKEPLKKFLITNAKELNREFLKKAKTPFSTPLEKGKTSKLLIKKEYYYYALAYAKYLEYANKKDESLIIYKSIFKGLNQLQAKDAGFIYLYFRRAIEEITVKSLQKSINNNIYSKSQKKKLRVFLENKLFLNTKPFNEALEYDLNISNQECLPLLLSLKKDNNIFSSTNIIKAKSFNLNVVYQKVCAESKKKMKHYNKRVDLVTNKIEADELESIYKKQEILLEKKLQTLKDKPYKEIKLLKSNQQNYIEIFTNVFFSISRPHFAKMKLDFIKRVELNKQLIKSL